LPSSPPVLGDCVSAPGSDGCVGWPDWSGVGFAGPLGVDGAVGDSKGFGPKRLAGDGVVDGAAEVADGPGAAFGGFPVDELPVVGPDGPGSDGMGAVSPGAVDGGWAAPGCIEFGVDGGVAGRDVSCSNKPPGAPEFDLLLLGAGALSLRAEVSKGLSAAVADTPK
jgi:hypothetical protein